MRENNLLSRVFQALLLIAFFAIYHKVDAQCHTSSLCADIKWGNSLISTNSSETINAKKYPYSNYCYNMYGSTWIGSNAGTPSGRGQVTINIPNATSYLEVDFKGLSYEDRESLEVYINGVFYDLSSASGVTLTQGFTGCSYTNSVRITSSSSLGYAGKKGVLVSSSSDGKGILKLNLGTISASKVTIKSVKSTSYTSSSCGSSGLDGVALKFRYCTTSSPLSAVNDSFTIPAGTTSTNSVLANDTDGNGTSPAVVGITAGRVKLTQLNTSNSGVNIDPSNGKVVVSTGTPNGTYTINYQICAQTSLTTCKTATVTVNVTTNTTVVDLDADNDGILDALEMYGDQKYAPNGTFPTSSNAASSPLYSKQLLFFDWSGVTLSPSNPTATKSVVVNGVTYTATISNYSSTVSSYGTNDKAMVGYDILTWAGSSQMIGRYYNVNSTAFKEVLYTPNNVTGTNTFTITVSAKIGNVEYPVNVVVFDAESTNVSSTQNEKLSFTTTGSNFSLLEQTGTGSIGNNITGVGTNTLTFVNTQTSNVNGLYTTSGLSPKITASVTTSDVSQQGVGFAVRLYKDTDMDGIPDYLDLDSDGDGCYDAIEGDENVNITHLNDDGSIAGAVDAQGVPMLVNAGGIADVGGDQGQGIGTSTDATIQNCINAVNDSQTINAGATGTISILDNDVYGGAEEGSADLGNVNITQISTTNSGVNVNISTGLVQVAAGTPAGSYLIVYKICDKVNTGLCDNATVTVTVNSTAILGQNDDFNEINGFTGGTTPSVLSNDTLGGQPATTSNVNLTAVSVPAELTLNADGTITVAPNTPADDYMVSYRIEDKSNTGNFATAVANVPVIAPIIDAVADSYTGINSSTGGTTTSVLVNDTLNGQPLLSSNVTLSAVSVPSGLTLNADGTIAVAAGTTPGTYDVAYQICEITNPTNCDTVTSTVEVTGNADLSLAVSFSRPVIIVGDDNPVFYRVSNTGNAPTNGSPITLTINSSRADADFSSVTVPTGWTLVSQTATGFVYTTTKAMVANTTDTFVFNYVIGTVEPTPIVFTGVMTPGSGGDNNSQNNSASVALSTTVN